ncbi:hypothetical protein GCM10022226_56170 [Sphaerisporangium flaviroseum]|uniref:HEXXH motif domain-containing protein n=1 Tax=Sphaerisporangium flaviroseum TaxID=509199 RepID=A0ABP7IVT0_9ACTN
MRAKFGGLEAELASWTELSRAGGPLEKHHTQVAAIVAAMAVPIAELRPRLDDPGTWAQTERLLIRVHAVLEYFRSKLMLRFVPAFRDYLAMADQYAWECYLPARQRATVPREPPLTFFSPDTTPFAIPRGASYRGELSVLTEGSLRAVVERLPVPVIGIPWFQLKHLPDAMVLAHEVGHHVEIDFRLTPTLERLVSAAVPVERAQVWRRWLGEVFADVYGALAGGTAFCGALADFVATGPATTDGAYPPPAIRVALVTEALRASGLPGHPPDDRLPVTGPYGQDAGPVAAALVAGPYPEFGDVPLTHVIDFAPQQDVADRTAERLLRGHMLPATTVRTLLAAAAIAFARDPLRYERGDVADVVVKAALATITAGIRATPKAVHGGERDQAAGRAILDLLAVR